MICPFCLIQMHQEVIDGEPQGGGTASDAKYETWEIKVCPECGRRVREYYLAKVLGVSKGGG